MSRPHDPTTPTVTRRGALAAGAGAGSPRLGVRLGRPAAARPATPVAWLGASGASAPNARPRLDPDGVPAARVNEAEVGQGERTGLAGVVAEELAAVWERVRTEPAAGAPVDRPRRHRRRARRRWRRAIPAPPSRQPTRPATRPEEGAA